MIVDTVFLEKGLKAAFDDAYSQFIGDRYSKILALLTTEVPSTSASEKYGWMGDVPAVREWLGDKQSGTMVDYNYTIPNKDWESTIDIDRDELDDDQLGRILPRIQMMAQRMKSWKGKLVAQFLAAGTTGLAYDGSAYFANRTAPNDNLLAGSGNTAILGSSGLTYLEIDIAAARAAMQEFVSDKGEPLGLELDTIVCPSGLESLFIQACMSPQPMGVTNPATQWIKNVICLPGLSDQTDWYGFCTGYALKPFIFQNRKDTDLVLDDTQVKRNRKLYYSAESRGNAGYGFFQMGVKVVNS
jgi:phage major head subunit gpT-like protein